MQICMQHDVRWLECNRTQGNAVSPSTENDPRRQIVTSNFLRTRGTVEETPWRRNLCWRYRVIVPGHNVFVCISNASRSDRANSKLEYCGATWLQNDWLWGLHQRRPQSQPRVYSSRTSQFPL